LDRCVDQLLAFEGGPQPRRVMGGYSDYAQVKPAPVAAPKAERKAIAAFADAPVKARKLSFKEKRELEQLEVGIAGAETRQLELEEVLASQGTNYGAVRQAHEELEKLKADLERQMERWAELAEFAE